MRTIHRGIAPVLAAGAFALGGLGAVVAPGTAEAASSRCDGMTGVSGLASVTYADRLVQAWGRGDTRATECFATPAVESALWAVSDTGGAHWKRTVAEGAAGTVYVTYRNQSGPGQVVLGITNVGHRNAGGWHAARVARLTGNPVHAFRGDALMRAWGHGDRTAASWFGTSAVVRQLFAHRSVGGSHWHRVATDATAGSTYATYRDGTTRSYITLRVLDPTVTHSWAHDVTEVRFGR